MAGLLIASIGTGQLITRYGRYKIYPIVGTLFMALGLILLSRLDEHTSAVVLGVDMAVFGFGLGLTMQVLIIAVQNAVDYANLGTATSGATYFRSIGGSFGASIFGTILNNRLRTKVTGALTDGTLPPNFPMQRALESPTSVHRLPAAQSAPFLHIFALSMQTVFLIAVPITLVAFLLTLFLREVPLRGATRTPDLGESSGLPTFRSSLDEIERALTRLTSRQNLWDRYEAVIERAGVDITIPQAYGVFRLYHAGPITDEAAARRLGLPVEQIRAKIDGIIAGGFARRDADGLVTLTPAGVQIIDQLSSARSEILQEQLAGWSPEQHSDLLAMLHQLADNSLDAPDRDVMSRQG
jgi:DNA-binding MarR family transcriptional regulator